MSDDKNNVFQLHKGGKDEPPPPDGPTADEVLESAMGKYTDVIVIGLRDDAAQCISTVGLDQAVYELSRAIHKLHIYIDRM